jgi:hypothetical protein
MSDTTEPRSITDLRRALLAEYLKCAERRKPHFDAFRADDPASIIHWQAYEGLVGTGTYAWLIAGVLRLLEKRDPDAAADVAQWVELSLDSGVEWLEHLNNDIDFDSLPATVEAAATS